MPGLWDSFDQAQQPQPAPDMWRAPYGVGSDAEMAGSPSGLGSLASGLYQYLGNLAKRNIGNAQTYSQTGEYNPAPAVEAAMLPMGTGAIAGAPVRAGEAALGAGPIRAYHGSPYDFSAFDASKIGTGEGAQAYGHGLYFAESPKVAEQYRFVNSSPGLGAYPASLANSAWTKAQQLGLAGDDATRAALADLQAKASRSPASAQQAIFDAMNNFDKLKTGKVGHGYEVNIHADPAQMLNFDASLSGQSKVVQDLLPQISKPHDYVVQPSATGKTWSVLHPGGWVPNAAQNFYKSEAAAAAAAEQLNRQRTIQDLVPRNYEQASVLGDAGIPGIRYLDQGSRGAGSGTSNYVVFDPKIVDILRKYGIVGLAPMAAGFGFPSVQGSNEQRM